MKTKLILSFALIFLFSLSFASSLIVDADYVTIYSGEQATVGFEIENNENFDIEEVSMALVLTNVLPDGTPMSLPFTCVGSCIKDVDDIRENKDEEFSFTLRASTDITPGDYNIPYTITYVDENDDDTTLEKTGTFGLRVSAKTDLDFGIEAKGEDTDSAIVGEQGKITLEIINKGLGDLKSVQVDAIPQGFELLSKNKIFIGTVNAEDTDIATFEGIFKKKNPNFSATITYKDFDNEEHTETINFVLDVYTMEEALELGIITKSNTGMYVGIIVLLIIIWIVYKKIKKNRKKKKGR